jgi:E3 ubiquitin-protein ligase TRIP12
VASPDEMLLAVRAITYLCDAMPRAADAVVRHGLLPVLCSRLLAIEYLDVAEQVTKHAALETPVDPLALKPQSNDRIYLIMLVFFLCVQCLQAFEKISRRKPTQCLQAGMITAVLAYIDFFASSIQVLRHCKNSIFLC